MSEIPDEVMRAVKVACTQAFALAAVVPFGRLTGMCVVGVPRHTHLACILRVAGFEPQSSHPQAQVWMWRPPPDRKAN